jgi:uncharacterized membrane protein YraQ (UPF0718 family)
MVLLIITATLLLISFVADRKKTMQGLKKAIEKFLDICIPIILILICVSFVLYLIPGDMISQLLSDGNRYLALFIAAILGSMTMMPGFIAFPLCGILKQNNVPLMVISAFTTTLMMVGIITFPIEKKYFGNKVAVIRNVIGFFIAVLVALATGIFFKEIFI